MHGEIEMDQKVAATPVAVVGLGAILPDAPDVQTFWKNVKSGHYSITEVSPDRWDPKLYYDPDPLAPDKTYSKIGGWVREWTWDPFAWHLPIPPRVGDALDDGQKWAIACTRAALEDYGYPSRPLDPERTAVILGSALGGEKHYFTSLRAYFPEYADELQSAPAYRALPREVQAAILDQLHAGVTRRFPKINEDALPGELGNILAGRVANLFNFRGPSFTVDAACASGVAAVNAATEALAGGDVDMVVGGGIDRNMGANLYVKFSKIGALSATGTRPYAEGADGFVMGEGAVVFLLKRLADAERDDDRIYAVIRGSGGSSDGKGKGITAPNPIGQRLAIERAWRRAGVSPATVGLVEGHGTSTRVGDVVELEGLHAVFCKAGLAPGSVALGSVKSNIGHLKAGAGAAGLLKTVLALSEKVLPPSLHFARPNPEIDFANSPFRVNTELREWETPAGDVRRAGVSAFGFGGTNFHAVVDEYVPGAIDTNRPKLTAVSASRVAPGASTTALGAPSAGERSLKSPLRGALVIGADDADGLAHRLQAVLAEAQNGRAPAIAAPAKADLCAPHRLAIDYADAAELANKASMALKAVQSESAAAWRKLEVQGVFRGHGPAPKVAFLYTGQGSQYVNMLGELRRVDPVVTEVFDEADRIMTPLLGRPLSDFIFVNADDPGAVAAAEQSLSQTAVTQPAVLTVDLALTRLLAAYGIRPDMVMGHSMGEYGALVAAGSLTFEGAIEAVSARGREVRNLSVEDPGKMVAVLAPLAEIERIVAGIDGYVVVVNVNSTSQAVIGGATVAVESAVQAIEQAGFTAVPLPISHAFHTSIVAPACEPLRRALMRLDLRPPSLPIVANLTGDFYPMGPGVVPEMLDTLAKHVASPVQFVKGLHTLYDAGVRAFVEVGPKWALRGFVADVLGGDPSVRSLFTNHPKFGDVVSFNQALCGLYAAGLGAGSGAGTLVVASALTTPEPSGFEAAGAVPRRVPVPVLRPPLGLCVTTGVTFGETGRVVVMPDAGGVATALSERLRARGMTPLVIDGRPDAASLADQLRRWTAEGPVQGVYWLPALDWEGDLRLMDLAGWREALRVRVKLLYTTMQTLYDTLCEAGNFLVSATRLGGQHGYDPAGAFAPMGGAVTGFTKAYKRERDAALVKAVDFEAGADASSVADLLIGETLRDPGAVEVGHRGGLRWTVGLEERPAADGRPGLRLTRDTVFLVTGAAGGIVSAIVTDLAAASGGTFHLLDLAPPPDPADSDLERFVSDREGLKHDLIERIRTAGERPTPAIVERRLAAIERKQAALAAITAVQASGGAAHYHQVDLTDAPAVAAVIDSVRAAHGRIDVLLHAAGMEISRLLPDKQPREFDLVFDVKSDGWFNLLHAVGDMPLGSTVAFASVAGRFGNGGQTDYSSANDLLCKVTSNLRTTRPDTRGIAIDWTAWTGIGMATRGSIPKMMELAGIDMLRPEAGVPVIRRELTTGGTRGEVVIANRLGALLDEGRASGGLDADALKGRGPMIGPAIRMELRGGLTVETTLDPAAQGFLRDHTMDGTPLLPGVMGIEGFAELAQLPLPGWSVVAVEDVRFEAPFKFYRGAPRTLTLTATYRQEGEEMIAECRLVGVRKLVTQPEPQLTTHFTGRVRLSRTPVKEDRVTRAPTSKGLVIPAADIYKVLFHGPAYRVLAREQVEGRAAVGLMASGLPDNHSPASLPTVMSPRLIELCFQTAGIWEMATKGRFALPLRVESVSALMSVPDQAAGSLSAVVMARDDDAFDAVVVDEAGNVFLRLVGYHSVELPGAGGEEIRRLLQGGSTTPPEAVSANTRVGEQS